MALAFDPMKYEDILTKMIKKFPLTLNFFWVVYIYIYNTNLVVDSNSVPFTWEAGGFNNYAIIGPLKTPVNWLYKCLIKTGYIR